LRHAAPARAAAQPALSVIHEQLKAGHGKRIDQLMINIVVQ
jgi:hypothetical protein